VDELRKDPTRGQWSLIRPKRASSAESGCPYCPGAEQLAGREIAAYRKDGSLPNEPGWTVRVVPEADAYFRIEHELVREGVGMFDMITPRGASELILESPNHDDTLATMDPEQLESVLWMYRDRLVDLKRDGQIRDILIARHHRKPGVRPHHPYSRVTAIPIVFDETRRELRELKPVQIEEAPDVASLRRRLRLSQGAFATLFGIPLATVKDWEQGRRTPDAPARAYLRVIAQNPRAVRNALKTAAE